MTVENIKMKCLVIDASFLLSFLFPNETNRDAEVSLNLNSYNCISSTLLDFEILNALQSGVKRKRISEKQRMIIQNLYFQIPIQRVTFLPSDFILISELASESKLSLYDSSYLYLAKRESGFLASFDEQLIKEAKKLKIELFV